MIELDEGDEPKPATPTGTFFEREPFKFVWDGEANVGYMYVVRDIKDGEAAVQRQLADNVIADFDVDGRLLGIEFLGTWATNLEDDPPPRSEASYEH